MGFLKNLFTPKKEICEVIVLFYNASEATVTFFRKNKSHISEVDADAGSNINAGNGTGDGAAASAGINTGAGTGTSAGALDKDMVLLFLLYYGRILFNLGIGNAANFLTNRVQVIISDIFDIENKAVKRTRILENYGLQHLNLLYPKDVQGKIHKKFYSGTLLRRADGIQLLTLNYTRGGEEHYAPASVFFFLQWLMENAFDKTLVWCITGLYMVNEYFLNVGSYTDIDHVMGAAHGAMNEMAGVKIELDRVKVM